MNGRLLVYWRPVVIVVVALWAGLARAEPDSFWLGSGRDGALTVSAAGTVVNRYAQVMAPLAPGDISIEVGSTVGFAAGDLLMVHQSTGLLSPPASGSGEAINLTSLGSPVGRWELARIASVAGKRLNLTVPLFHAYTAGVSQVVRVPEYTSVTIDSGATLVASPWNGSMGGILALLVQGDLSNNGEIQATGAGFRGGTYVKDTSGGAGCSGLDAAASQGAQRGEGIANTLFGPASTGRGNITNAGGGGVCLRSGGGGGSNYGKGGQGGYSHETLDGKRNVGGLPGAPVSFNPLERLLFGGGGGSGHGSLDGGTGQSGGSGGGIIFIRANRLVGQTGRIGADGVMPPLVPTVDGSGGGGGGGTLMARFVTSAVLSRGRASGGQGGYTDGQQGRTGPGGGGGGGYIYFQSSFFAGALIAAQGSDGKTIVNGTAEAYGATLGAGGTLVQLDHGLIRPDVPQLQEPLGGAVTGSRRPLVRVSYAGAGVASSAVLLIDGVWSGVLGCNSDGATEVCVGSVQRDLTDGAHQLQVAAAVEGLWSERTAPISFSVDLTPPGPPEVTPPGAQLNVSRPVFKGTAEAGSTVEVFIRGSRMGSTQASGTGAWSFQPSSPLADGAYSLQASATDIVGNVGAKSASLSFVIDTQAPPAPSITKPTSGAFITVVTPTIEGSSVEVGGTVAVLVDDVAVGNTVVDGSGTWSLTLQQALKDGAYSVKAFVLDAAGNVGASSAARTFTVDTMAPDVSITAAPPLASNRTQAALSFTSGDSTASFKCSLDGEAFGSCSSPYNAPALSDGVHTFDVRAQDAAGNQTPSAVTHTWTVDTLPPQVPVLLAPSTGQLVGMAPAFSGTAEPGSTVRIVLDDAEIGMRAAGVDGTWSLTPGMLLAEGPHGVRVRATDAAGNTSADSGAQVFLVDAVAPETRIVSAPPAQTESSSATFDFESEAGATFECSLDDADFAPCTDPVTYSNLTPGNHNLRVRAKDAVANVDGSPATQSWSITRLSNPGGGSEEPSQGCGCASSGADPSAAMIALAGLAALASRRRRK